MITDSMKMWSADAEACFHSVKPIIDKLLNELIKKHFSGFAFGSLPPVILCVPAIPYRSGSLSRLIWPTQLFG